MCQYYSTVTVRNSNPHCHYISAHCYQYVRQPQLNLNPFCNLTQRTHVDLRTELLRLQPHMWALPSQTEDTGLLQVTTCRERHVISVMHVHTERTCVE